MQNQATSSYMILFRVATLVFLSLLSHDSSAGISRQSGGISRPANGTATDLFQIGLDLCDQGKYTEALPVYQQITRNNPDYAMGWMGLGWSLHYTERYSEAVPAYLKALDLGAMTPNKIMMELARCYAAWGKKEDALLWLERSVQAGWAGLDRIRTDERLDPLKSDPKFIKLAAIVDISSMDRNEAWNYDVRFLAREIKRMHYSPYRAISSAELDREIEKISAAIPSLTDFEITTRLKRLMREIGDGHTYAEAAFEYDDKHQQSLPVLFAYFEEGIYITAVTSGHEDLLWARVVKFDQTPVEKVYKSLVEITPQDNPVRPKSLSPQYMRYPQILKGLGLVIDPSKADLTVVDRTGTERVVTLEVGVKSVAANEWIRKPAEFQGEWPLYLQNRFDLYWFKYFPGTKILYFQYNGVGRKSDESPEVFAARLSEFIQQNNIEKLIVDLRWNGGGNVFLSKPIFQAIAGATKLNQSGKLFVIAGRHTFSAAMIFAAQLERYTPAIFVGEPTGSSPNFVGETNFVTLPYSKIRVSISNLYWENSTAMDHRIWIDPKINIPVRFDDYKHGSDPALDAILRYGAS
jgi:hypothetical protein